MKYPESVLTRNRKGETEVRLLVDRGSFVRYTYVYPDGKPAEGGKMSIILTSGSGRKTHYFLIPTKGGRYLAILPKEEKSQRKVWDKKSEKEVEA